MTRNQQNVELSVLDNCVREALDPGTPRAFAVTRPLKIVIENYPEDKEETLEALNHPGDESLGTRSLPFCRELYIEQEDFQEDPPKKFFRLAPGREVRLRYAYLVTCTEVIKDSSGEIIQVRCTYDPETRGGNAPDGRKVKGTIHWVSARHSAQAQVRLYEPLFVDPEPNVSSENDLQNALNETSLTTLDNVQVEPSLTDAPRDRSFSLNVWDTSVWIGTAPMPARYSTAPSRCGTPGQKPSQNSRQFDQADAARTRRPRPHRARIFS